MHERATETTHWVDIGHDVNPPSGACSNGVGQSHEGYLHMDNNPSGPLLEARQALWQLLSDVPFSAVTPNDAKFAHLGTTMELMEVSECATEGWRPCLRVSASGPTA